MREVGNRPASLFGASASEAVSVVTDTKDLDGVSNLRHDASERVLVN